MFLILYSRFALVLVRSLRSVSNYGEKSRKKNTKNISGQAKMDKNSVINVTWFPIWGVGNWALQFVSVTTSQFAY